VPQLLEQANAKNSGFRKPTQNQTWSSTKATLTRALQGKIVRKATQNDLQLFLELMTEFYAESGYELERESTTKAFHMILEQPDLGQIWLIQDGTTDVGHVLVTFKFAMEYAGMIACIDDLFVMKAFRNRGLSTSALEEIREYCQANQLRGMTVEVGNDNAPAQKVYRRIGFKTLENRELLGLALENPAHVV
jgi:ribosomal protein S18 acetylase RimI-like enzyme